MPIMRGCKQYHLLDIIDVKYENIKNTGLHVLKEEFKCKIAI